MSNDIRYIDILKKEIEESIQEIDKDIEELKNQKKLLQRLDITQPITEDGWHELCETPLRGSKILEFMVKNIFPCAEDIQVSCNYVYFTLYGINVQIPTSRTKSINIDTSWYKYDYLEPPKFHHRENIESILNYYYALENKLGWYECIKNRIYHSKNTKKWKLFLFWFGKYKWKPLSKIQMENLKEAAINEKIEYRKSLERYQENVLNTKQKVDYLFTKVLPMVDKFSLKHRSYNDVNKYFYKSIEQIKENEEKIRTEFFKK